MRHSEIVLLASFAIGCSSSSGALIATTDGGADASLLADGGPSENGSDAEAEDAEANGDGGDATEDAASDVSADGCITDTTPGDHVFMCAGLTVDVAIPDTCPASGCGLVLDVHGVLESGPIEEAHMAIRPIAKAQGYVVIQPSASYVSSVGGRSWQAADDDRVMAIVDAVAGALGVDPARTHMTGFSQGGFMAWRFLCKHADRFASIAPGSAGKSGCVPTLDSCTFTGSDMPSRQIDVLFLSGRTDGVVPFECQTAERDLLVSAWGLGAPQTVGGDAKYTRARFTNAQGTVLETLEHSYATDPNGILASNKGHCYPGSQAHLGNAYDQLACLGPNAFAWGAAVMDFFVAHPK